MIPLVRRMARASFALAGVFLLVQPSYAVDGVVLIDEAAALAGGVTPGDGPGYPVQLTVPGSYRLSSDLVVPAGASNGVLIESDDVTLDLNGFTVQGAGSKFTDGIGIWGTNVEVRKGTVRGFGRHGIFSVNARCDDCELDSEGVRIIGVRAIGNGFNGIRLESQGGLVDGCTAFANGNAGINVQGGGTLVQNSVARANVTYGIIGGGFGAGAGSGYRANVLTANNGGDANPQVHGGVNLGQNQCGLAACP
jgi:hypothetical protein